jgi:hypothetical protein
VLDVDVEFRVVYVGSAGGPDHDQILESVMVGPIPVGVSKFVLEVLVINTRHPLPIWNLFPNPTLLD